MHTLQHILTHAHTTIHHILLQFQVITKGKWLSLCFLVNFNLVLNSIMNYYSYLKLLKWSNRFLIFVLSALICQIGPHTLVLIELFLACIGQHMHSRVKMEPILRVEHVPQSPDLPSQRHSLTSSSEWCIEDVKMSVNDCEETEKSLHSVLAHWRHVRWAANWLSTRNIRLYSLIIHI